MLHAQERSERRFRVDVSGTSPPFNEPNDRLGIAGLAERVGYPADSLDEVLALVIGEVCCPVGHLERA